MDLFERDGLGRMDPSNFGLWLNLEPLIDHPRVGELLPLTMSSFHFPVGENHREFVNSLENDEDKGFAIGCLTMFTHETRHFHDLLATPYGSVLMRQYTRAALLVLFSRTDLFLRAPAIAVPLPDWIANANQFSEMYGIDPPSANLRAVGEELAQMQQKLNAFNRGTIQLEGRFKHLNANAILEGLAVLTQELKISEVFGDQMINLFRSQFQRSDDTWCRYYGAIEFLATVLQKPIPREALMYYLLASLFGNFQDQNPDHLRYPKDVLVDLAVWLRDSGFDAAATTDFEKVIDVVDSYFEDRYGDTLQGMTIQAAKANQGVAAAFAEMARKFVESGAGESAEVDSLLKGFDNFWQTQAAFAANVTASPLWFCETSYLENVRHLPSPVIFMECESGIPVDETIDGVYYIVTESRIDVRNCPPSMKPLLDHGHAKDGVLRGAHVLSPRSDFHVLDETESTLHLYYQMPAIDVGLWQRNYDAAAGLLRFLIEGVSKGIIKPHLNANLVAFATAGTRVFTISGELAAPPIPDDPDSPVVDPEARRLLQEGWFRDALQQLRKMKRENGPSGS